MVGFERREGHVCPQCCHPAAATPLISSHSPFNPSQTPENIPPDQNIPL